MLVKNWMNKPVITVDENDSMSEALKRMTEHNIRKLPAMKKGKLVGIITDGDLKKASASDATTLEVHELVYLTSQIKVKHIMTKDVITVPFNYTVEETAELLLDKKISGVPVMDENQNMVGIITEMDIFRVLISLTGVGKRGIQFAFQDRDESGRIKELTDTIRKYNARMASILSTYENVPNGYRRIYLRIYQVNRSRLPELVTELREQATMLYMVDHRENRREIF